MEGAVVEALGIGDDRGPGAAEQAGEQVDHHRQPESLVAELEAAEGKHRAAVAQEGVGIGARPPGGIDQRAFGQLRVAVARLAHLVDRHLRGGDVEQDGIASRVGEGGGDRVGADTPADAAERRDLHAAALGVAEGESHQPRLRRHFRIGADPAHMLLVAHRHRRDVAGARLFHGQRHAVRGGDMAEGVAAVEHRGGGGLLDRAHFGRWHDQAHAHPAHVIGDVADAMGVMADQVGFDH